MRVLYVVPYVPSPIRTRPYGLLRALARRGHDLTVATLETPAEAEALRRLRAEGFRVVAVPFARREALANLLRALPTRTPLQAAFNTSPAFAHLLETTWLAESYDVVHVEHLRGVQYALFAQGRLRHWGLRTPVVWDAVDSISLLFARAAAGGPSLRTRLMARVDLARTRRYEGEMMRRLGAILVTSPEDARAFEDLAGAPAPTATQAALHVVPNGVDLTDFRPSGAPRALNTVVFSGKMSYHANVAAALDLAQTIMPLVWTQRPEVRLQIVGKDPAPQVQALAADPRIEVTGEVPAIAPYLERATAVACPLRYGVGIQNKVLEALAMAAPVVVTRQAVAALQARDGQDLLVATDAPSFAGHLLRLLNDPLARERLGQAGRRYVEARHDWQVIAQQLEAIYARARP